jgi:CDP-glycerol glycerophosphotransferase
MKTSIIIPYDKGESYLRDCLDSLKEQTRQDMEILLICDHVDKKDLNFIKEYETELTIQLHHLQVKTGVAAARNLGLEKATGDYVYFLDSDDYLYGNTIENLVLVAQERDDDIVYGKKKPTWFGRSVFLARKQEQETDDLEEESEGSTEDSAELRSENGGEDEKESSSEDNSEEDSTDDNAEEDESDEAFEEKVSKREKEDSEDSDKISSDDGEVSDRVLTEERLIRLKEIRKRQACRVLVSKRKGVRNISVLNILFKRSFLEDNNIRFPEKLIYLSDVPFLLEALSKTDKLHKRLSAKYIKRKHNDSIHFPSLSQIKDPNRFYEFLDAYYETTKRIPKDSDLKNQFDKKYISYYARIYAPRLKRSKNPAWREENFLRMSEIISGMNSEVLHSLKGYRKRIVKALIKKDVKKSLRIVTMHLGFRKLKKILKNKRAFAKFLYVRTFLEQPLQENWILFESFFGKNYSDSPKYVYEYLAKNYPGKYKFIWVIDKKNTKIPYKHTKIKRYGILYSYYLARCKYFVFNGRQPEWVKKRDGNIFLQTWHGTPLKKLVFDIDDISSATPKYKQQVFKQSRAWDYLIAPNAFSSETFRRCFMFDNKMLETGYPRNDILHDPNRDEIAKSIRKQLGIPKDKKAILYAPTWRDDEFYAKGQYKFELHLNLEMMRQQLGDEYVLLLRTHYFIADALDVSALKGFAFNLSRYDDISELYLISDILITDYSSVFFDYANLKRPMLFFTYDLEKYRDVLRGFYFDIEKEVPGPLLYTTEEVVDAVKNIDTINDEYSQRYQEFYQRICEWEDGHAAEKVVKSVFVK